MAAADLKNSMPAAGAPEAHGSTRTRARNIRRRRVAARQRASIDSTSISNTTAGPAFAAPQSDPSCASYNTNRLLRMLAVKAFFEEGGLGHFEGLLRSTWHFLDVPLVWQVEQNDGSWMDCSEDTQRALRLARDADQTEVMISSHTWCYQVDLLAMTQTNMSTRRSRQLRCQDPYCCIPSVPRRPKDSGPKWQFQSGHGWADCDHKVCALLEGAWQRGEEIITCSGPFGFTLFLDLRSMTQTNASTGRVRQLRRCKA